jgi:hypothetical protein
MEHGARFLPLIIARLDRAILLPAAKKMPGSSPGKMRRGVISSFIFARLDRAILYVGHKKDARVKPGHDEML